MMRILDTLKAATNVILKGHDSNKKILYCQIHSISHNGKKIPALTRRIDDKNMPTSKEKVQVKTKTLPRRGQIIKTK